MAPVYATADDLAEYLGTDAPDNADRLLKRASRTVDTLLVGAVYDTDSQQQPTNDEVLDALREATVAQAAYWHHNGMPSEGLDRYGQVQIGSVQLSRGESAPSDGMVDGVQIAPGVTSELRLAGLLPIKPRIVG